MQSEDNFVECRTAGHPLHSNRSGPDPMSRQLHLYLLPSDVETLIQNLRLKLGVELVQPWSPEPTPVFRESPMLTRGITIKADCYMVPGRDAKIIMNRVPGRARWEVDIGSELIEFRGCEFDGKVLVRGRFYFQNDVLIKGNTVAKHRDFLTWSDRFFRLTKKLLGRSKAFDAYVGSNAQEWKEKGGRFAWIVSSARGPIYEDECA